MTDKEKAQAYDKALNWMRTIYPSLSGADKEDAEHFFPQLAESEDEKIRNEILTFIKHFWADYKESLPHIISWISYLEKQKEQKHPDGCFTCDEYKKGYEEGRRNGFTAGYNKAMKEVEQKEQKPAEKQDYSGLNDLERAIHRGFLCAGVENVSVTIIKETAKECLAQMKLAGWSNEDKAMIKSILFVLESYVSQSESASSPSLITTYPIYYKEIDWLKSLRPSWKPSEEQMKALNAINCHGGLSYVGQQSQLISLYNNLKNLM